MHRQGLGWALLVALAGPLAGRPPEPVPDRLLIRYRRDAEPASIERMLAVQGLKSRQRERVSIVDVSEGALPRVQAFLERTGLFDYVERDYYAHTAAIPNDPSFDLQWHLNKIQAPAAWDITTGAPGTVIAVIDSGVDPTHPELAPRLVTGWSFLARNTNTADTLGHGTAVAGTVAAATNNGAGVAGVTWSNRVMPLVVVDETDSATYSDIARAICHAADRGVRVINISLGGPAPSATLQDAVDYAWNKGAVIFAAAMNAGTSTPYYPAACRRAVAVSATDANDNLAAFSGFGSWITLSAPGSGILTTANGGGYGYWAGTSFASPIAAAVAGLALSVNPSLSNEALVTLLKETSDDLGEAGFDARFGWGRVNAWRAVQAAAASVQNAE